MIDFKRVGMRIADHRRRLDLSQEELAAKLYVTRQAVSKWEKGASVPSIDLLCELSRVFGVTPTEILGLFDDIPNDVDPDDIFRGHDRGYVISGIISGKIQVRLPDVFYQMSPAERMLLLRKIKDGVLNVDMDELLPRLTPSESAFLRT